MVKEPKDVDFHTTGRQPSEEEFARISEWINQDKQKQAARKPKLTAGSKSLAQLGTTKSKVQQPLLKER